MIVTAVIAECNPFHNGHRYLARKARELTGADYVVAVMSGPFVQRGAPAVLDKYTRTQMALCGGVDLVAELPAVYALSQAEQFAAGGVRIADAMGCDFLCFGCENDNLSCLTAAAQLFNEEPDDYWEVLSGGLRSGLSYPAAREAAACELLLKRTPEIFSSKEDITGLLQGPNNILAISYLQALLRSGSRMEPVAVKRIGSGHRDGLLREEKTPRETDPDSVPAPILLAEDAVPGTIRSSGSGQRRGKAAPRIYPSAQAIREVLTDSIETHRFLSAYPALRSGVPNSTYDLLCDARSRQLFQTEDDYSVMLRYRLLQMNREEILSCCGQNEDFANRLMHCRSGWNSVTQLTGLLKHKSRTWSGISRILFRMLLNMDDAAESAAAAAAPYVRVLGMRRDAAPLLKEWKAAGVPLLINLAEDEKALSAAQMDLLKTDLFAANLYDAVTELKTGAEPDHEYTRRFLTV